MKLTVRNLGKFFSVISTIVKALQLWVPQNLQVVAYGWKIRPTISMLSRLNKKQTCKRQGEGYKINLVEGGGTV